MILGTTRMILLVHMACNSIMVVYLLLMPAGKTYVGIQIIKLLITNTTNSHRAANRDGWQQHRRTAQHPVAGQPAAAAASKPDSGPILAVCYTNHAIDSLLEGLLDAGVATASGEMVRVGGGSKSERLEALNLREVSDVRQLQTQCLGKQQGQVVAGLYASHVLSTCHARQRTSSEVPPCGVNCRHCAAHACHSLHSS